MRHRANPISADGQRVFSALQQRIEQGDYVPGVWLPAERILADEFGVDRSIIRGALVKLEESGLIEREPGKRPWVKQPSSTKPAGSTARAVARVDSNRKAPQTVAIVIPQHPLYHAASLILHGINMELRMEEAPLHFQIYDTYAEVIEASTHLEDRALTEIERQGAAGVILWHMGGDATTPRLQRLQNLGIPMVFIDRFPPEMTCDFVGVDNCVSAASAVNYLLSLGHRNIAHLTSQEQTTAVIERRQGYLEALRAFGITPRPEWVFTSALSLLPDVRAAVRQFFDATDRPTAVFTMNDALAHYFIVEAEAQGYRVPADMSVMGFDDLERYSPRPALLTTLHQPFDQIGRRATRLLLQRVRSEATRVQPCLHILLSTELVVRSTCNAYRKETTG